MIWVVLTFSLLSNFWKKCCKHKCKHFDLLFLLLCVSADGTICCPEDREHVEVSKVLKFLNLIFTYPSYSVSYSTQHLLKIYLFVSDTLCLNPQDIPFHEAKNGWLLKTLIFVVKLLSARKWLDYRQAECYTKELSNTIIRFRNIEISIFSFLKLSKLHQPIFCVNILLSLLT